MRVSWKNGDVIYVYDGTQCLGSLVASLDGDEDRYALLSTDDSHTVKEPAAGTDVLTLVYSPLLTKAPSVAGNSISVSLAAQNTPKAPFVVFATLDYSGTSIANALVPFRFATSVIRVNCTGLNANTAITSATLYNVYTVCKLSLSGSTAPTVTGETNGTLTRTNDTYFAASEVNGEGEAVFQIAVPALEAASNVREFTVKQDSDRFVYNNFTKKALGAATSVNTVCQLKKLIIPAGALLGVFTVNDNGTPNDPSDDKKVHFSKGNLWVDGDTLHFEANQYAFNSSYQSTHVSFFTWSSTVDAAVSTSNSGDNLFCDENHKVSVDGSEAIYYALSTAEWQYLFNNHSKRWAKVNGVGGYV
ncbi:MAG: hypothetical protein KBS58_06765, partial [Bacteroidales bacterium]|nr:hypothetical protein [Candidatus Cacconaster equi]